MVVFHSQALKQVSRVQKKLANQQRFDQSKKMIYDLKKITWKWIIISSAFDYTEMGKKKQLWQN